MSRYLGPIDEGQDLITREWLEKNQDKLSIETHQYTGVYTSNTSYCYHYFLRLIPDDINCMWRVKYRMFIDAIGNSTYRGEYIVEWYGYGVTLTGQKIWNSRYNYPIYYHARAYPKDGAGNTAAANCLSYGHFFGVYINSDYNGNKAAYARNIKVELIDYNNCSIEFLDKCYNYYLDSMTLDVSGTQKTFKVNDICTVTTSNAITNGLQESSDSDTTTQNYLYNALFTLSERFSRYAIVGVDGDNKLHPISVYTNGSTKYSTSMASKTSGYRTYTQKGFDLSKGFFYCSSTGNYDADTNQVLTIYFNIPGIDFRYSDNCLASTTATNMGLECLKAVYLRGTIGTDGLFYVAPMDITYNGTVYQRAWTQDIPTEEDGYVYVLLGYPYYSSTYAHSEYRLTLVFEKKAYWYHDGAFRRYYSFKEISNTPTTLAGYGITDAKITDGIITLGSNTITPLTACGTSSQFLKADGSVDSTSYLSLSGNTTSNPITDTLYSKKGIEISNGNVDTTIWKIHGSDTLWNNTYGFSLIYKGTGSGNENDLILEAHNQTSTHINAVKIHQDGQIILSTRPIVGNVNVMLATDTLQASKLDNNYMTIAGTRVTLGGSLAASTLASAFNESAPVTRAVSSASADKLQTARKLWGNDFDGTADVSGYITLKGAGIKIVETLTGSTGAGEARGIHAYSSKNTQDYQASIGFLWGKTASNLSVEASLQCIYLGTGSAPWANHSLRIASNAVSLDLPFTSTSTFQGTQFKVTGGTASQFMKANGTLDSTAYLPLTGGNITGSVSINANLTVVGANTLRIGDATLAWDGVHECLTVDKSFYSLLQIAAGGAGDELVPSGDSSGFRAIRCTQTQYDSWVDANTIDPLAYYFIEEEE